MLEKIGRNLGAGLQAAGRAVPVLLRDAVGLTAIGSIAYGAWMIAPPAGFITGGVLLLIGAVLVSMKR